MPTAEPSVRGARVYLPDYKPGVVARTILTKYLEAIGWGFRNAGCGHWSLEDPKGNEPGWILWGDMEPRLTRERNHEELSVSFYLRDCEVRMLGGNCVSIGARSQENGRENAIFLQLYSHDMPQEDSDKVEAMVLNGTIPEWPSREALDWR